jgi:prepilin peptidase CpaA
MLALASIIDFRQRRIPNGLSFAGTVVGMTAQASLFGTAGLGLAVLGAAVCLLSFLPFYVGGGMAAGDVKLMAAVGAFLGPLNGLAACAFALVAGAIVASASAGWSRMFAHGVDDEIAASSGKIPYAVAILVGTLVVVLPPLAANSIVGGQT